MSQKFLQELTKRVQSFIRNKKIKSILVAISGGQDSILLIKILNSIQININSKYRISYIYIDHQWKKNSYQQIQHLVNYITIKKNIIIYQIHKTARSETECREQRYNLIYKYANINKYDLIVTGHNSDDKVETFFQNINRKSSTEGFSSPVIVNRINSKIFLLRPLLGTSKDNIYALCKKLNLPIWSDSTNYIYKINRNRLRYELIPYIRIFFNQKIENNLFNSTKNYYYENEYIKQNATKMYLHYRNKDKIAISCHNLIKQHIILQIKTLQIFYQYSLQNNISNKIIMKIIHFANIRVNEKLIIFEDHKYLHILNNKWLYIENKVK